MVGGARPKPAALKEVTGNPGHRPLSTEPIVEAREGPLRPPRKLRKAERELWERYVDTAWWLTEHDAPKAYAWCCLEAEFEKAPGKMATSRLGQLRGLATELGFDMNARARMGVDRGKKNPGDKFFDQ